MASFLRSHGITHYTTPPHTPQHNGFSERRHRHIVETGLSLLTHASLPLSYWPYAFSTATYLINRLPTPTLSLSSPYSQLFGTPPKYHHLRSFGCLCYSWLRPYSAHKLAPRSIPCTFIGYSLNQHAYLCLDPASHRVYVSRHVKFIEHIFPTATTPRPPPTPSTYSEWCSLDIPLLHPSPPPPTPPPSPSSSSSSTVLASPTPPSPSPPPPPPQPAPPPSGIITRSKSGISKPIQKLNLLAASPPPSPPTTVTKALQHPLWRQALLTEYQALLANHTWDLVPYHPSQNIVGCKWLFRVKYLPSGSVDRYKARLVAKGFHQRPGVDFFETYSPVVRPTTVRLVISLALSLGWDIRQLDVNNAFLQGTLHDQVFMDQPPGFLHPSLPHHVCRLKKAIYGLKQAPRAWYSELRSFLLSSLFRNSVADTSLFIYHHHTTTLYLLVYVDDIIITGTPPSSVTHFITLLSARFSLKDLGPLHYFLGIEVHPFPDGLFLSQRKYILDLLQRTNLSAAKPVPTPMSVSAPLSPTSGTPLPDPLLYRATVGSLHYLSLTRPDITYTVNKLSQFLQQPTDSHWTAVKRLLRYLSGTLDYGMPLYRHSPHCLQAFSDSDWAGNRPDYTSTSGFIVYLGSNPISWSSRKQKTVARSSTEAEYRTIATTAAEIRWLCSLLTELGILLPSQPIIFCDNVGATQLSANPVFHSRMKHVALDFHFIREQVQNGLLRVTAIPARDQLADILTKPLPGAQFSSVLSKLGLAPPPSSLRGHVKTKTEDHSSA